MAYINQTYKNWDIPQCLKITEKVSFNIANEASNIYVLVGQNFSKNAKNAIFSWFSNTVSILCNGVSRIDIE